jgi:hypothetical protein
MTVNELAEIVNGRVVGDGGTRIERIAILIRRVKARLRTSIMRNVLTTAGESQASCLIVTDAVELPNRTLIKSQILSLHFR